MAESYAVAAVKFLEEQLREKKLQITKIILFGSHARGHSSPESDLDIVVISKDFRKKDTFKRLALIKDAEIATIRKYMIPLDIIMMTPEEFTRGTSLVAAYAKKGKVISAASEDTAVKFWRVSDGKWLHTLDHKYPVDGIAFSPDGQTVITGSRDNKVRLWQATGGSPIYTIEKQGGPILDVTFSPDGMLGASASDDHTILFWRTPDGHPIKSLDAHQAPVSCMSFSKDGKLLLSGDNAGVVIAWGVR